jgi:glycine cleavage system H protein
LADATYPDDLRYHEEHDWVRIEGDQATFGITWYAQDSLGEVVFLDPPEVGTEIQKDLSYAEVNDTLIDAPEKINEDPYGEGWLVKVRLTAPEEAETLLGVEEYRKLLDS